MCYEIEVALEAHAENLTFDMECGSDRFSYEYGSIRGVHGDVYCDVTCQGWGDLTVEADADELGDLTVGSKGTHTTTVTGPRDADVEVIYAYTVTAISDAVDGMVQVTFGYTFNGKGSGSTDPMWDAEPDNYNDDYVPNYPY